MTTPLLIDTARLDRYVTTLTRHGAGAAASQVYAMITSGTFPSRQARFSNAAAEALAAELVADGASFTPDDDYGSITHLTTQAGGMGYIQSRSAALLLAVALLTRPSMVWSMREASIEEIETQLAIAADEMSDILDNVLYGYEMLPQPPEFIVVEHQAPRTWLPRRETGRYCAFGAIFEDVMLGLESFARLSGAGTRILDHWKHTRGRLIGHNVMNGAVSYFARNGFSLVPMPPPPSGQQPLTMMAWNYSDAGARARIEALGLTLWTQPGSGRRTDNEA